MVEGKFDSFTSRETKRFAKREGANTFFGTYEKVSRTTISDSGPETESFESGSFNSLCDICLTELTPPEMFELLGRYLCEPHAAALSDEILEDGSKYDAITVARARLILQQRRERRWRRAIQFTRSLIRL